MAAIERGDGAGRPPAPRPIAEWTHRALLIAAAVATAHQVMPRRTRIVVGRALRAAGLGVVGRGAAWLGTRAVHTPTRVAALLSAAWLVFHYRIASRRPRLTYKQGSSFIQDVLRATPSLLETYKPTPWAANAHVQLLL